MNDREFAEKAQDFLPDEIINEMSQMLHTAHLTATCEGHMLMSYIVDYGVNVLAGQVGVDEIKTKIWPHLQQMARDLNDEHIKSLGELREKYPEIFAEAESKATKSADDRDHKIALLRDMLGQVEK